VTTPYDDAIAALYRAPLEDFVAERKRLAKELGAAGDKSGAALLVKLSRPSVSAWATNQLYARAREPFDALFASAARLREGDLEAGAEHRRLTAKLVSRAADILKEAGHGASEAILRRVSANLAALAAAGSFEPDPPGALKHDRDPPGFEALAFGATLGETPSDGEPTADPKSHGGASKPHADPKSHGGASKPHADPKSHVASKAQDDAAREREEAARARAEAARAKAEAEAERRRHAEEQARVRAERRKLESALRAVKADVERLTSERDRLQSELTHTETELERAVAAQQDLDERLAQLPDPASPEP
jgi:hypothetical protein